MDLETVWDFFSDLNGINTDYEKQFIGICDEYRILPSKLREIWNRISKIRKTGSSLTPDSFSAFVRYVKAKIREPGYEPVYFNHVLKSLTIKQTEIEPTLRQTDFSHLIDEMTTIPGDIDLDLLKSRQSELVHRVRCIHEDYYEKLYRDYIAGGKEIYKGVLLKMNQHDDDIYRMNSFGNSIKEQPFILVYIDEEGSSTLKHIHLHFGNKTQWTGVLYTGKPVIVIGERQTFTKLNVELVVDGESEIDIEYGIESNKAEPVFKLESKLNDLSGEVDVNIDAKEDEKDYEFTVTVISEELSKGELSVYENIKGNLLYKFERLKEQFLKGKENYIIILGPFIKQTTFAKSNSEIVGDEEDKKLTITNSYKTIFRIIKDLKNKVFKNGQNVFIQIINSPNEVGLFPVLPICSPVGYKDKGLAVKSNPCTFYIKSKPKTDKNDYTDHSKDGKVRIAVLNYDIIFELMKHSTFVMNNTPNQKLDLIARELVDMEYFTPLLETANDYFVDVNKSSMLHKMKHIDLVITTSKLVEFAKKTKGGKLVLNVNSKKESQCWIITGKHGTQKNEENEKIDLQAFKINL